jgi:hypothetical protein
MPLRASDPDRALAPFHFDAALELVAVAETEPAGHVQLRTVDTGEIPSLTVMVRN